MSAANNSSTGWVGWGYFASYMMMLLGSFQIISGLVGIFKDDFYVVTDKSLVAFSYDTWGWINLVLGIVILCAGLALMNGKMWARVLAVLLAGGSLIANMGFMQAYPLWSILMIVVDILVIYALTVHGAELKE